MRSLISLGVVSLVGIAGMFACGDDDSNGPSNTAGTGGAAAGAGGSAGTGGSGGAGGAAAGTGGTAGGTAGAGGAANTPPEALATCTGCVELIVPATGPNDNGGTTNLADQVGYQFSFATPVDFSDGVVTWTVAAVEPNANTFVQLYAQNGMALNFAGAYTAAVPLDPANFPANQFREILIDLAAVAAAPGDAGVPDASVPPVVEVPDAGADAGDGGVPAAGPTIIGAFDKSQIIQTGITVGVSAAFTGSTVVRVAVDEVEFQGVPGQANRTFTAGTENLAINQYQVPPGTQPPFHHAD